MPTPVKALKKAAATTGDPALQAKARRILAQLDGLFPDPPIPLHHASSFQLLVAVMLSAQSTDKKVNELTPALFKLAPDAHAMSALPVDTIQEAIRAIGLAPTKSKNIAAMSRILVEQHRGAVPSEWEALEALPGVGHKTASVVMAQAFGADAFPVDTHIHRLATRWGLSNGKSVEQTEADLKALFPREAWRRAHLQIIYFGREHCPAKQHEPAACPICKWAAADDCSDKGGAQQSAAAADGEAAVGLAEGAPGALVASPSARSASTPAKSRRRSGPAGTGTVPEQSPKVSAKRGRGRDDTAAQGDASTRRAPRARRANKASD